VTREIDSSKKQIAYLVRDLRLISALRSLHDLLGLLANLGEYGGRIIPIEADCRRFRLQLHRSCQGREGDRHARQCANIRRRGNIGAPGGSLGFLLRLNGLPQSFHLRWRQLARLWLEDMRMPPQKLCCNGRDNAAKVERALLLCHLRMEDDLQQQIAELVAKIVEITARDCVGNLVGFLDGIGSDGPECLLEVPWTARVRCTQRRHNGEEVLNIARRCEPHAGCPQFA
jgi:hypothetical protein